ncbi:hypothetical protein BGZ75_000046 [Mortierella antarctica]|nr:hypothetical protein BGZ75_000046 [Mortierella antarctica]
MVASSSVPNSGPSIDWADDTDEEIDFAAPVFSDDEELAATLASSASSSTADYADSGDKNRRENAPAARYTAGRPPRTYMDQIAQANERPRRHSRDQSSESRWEKTPHEDKPYPVNHQPVHSASPINDTIYFKRRDGRPMEADSRERGSSGTMYHEQVEANNARHRSSNSHTSTNDKWEKTVLTEPDLPYPEKPIILVTSGSKVHQKDSKARTHHQPESAPVVAAPEKFSSSPRGTRGKGKEQNKRKSKDRPMHVADEKDQQDDGASSEKPWWEQSTYGAGSKAKKDDSTAGSGKGASSEGNLSKAVPSAKETAKVPVKPKDTPTSATEATDAAGEVPWWEQSTYKAKPKTVAGEAASQQASAPTKSESETIARREALGKKTLTSGIEDLTLVSRGGDDSGSSHSLKSRSVQERVFSEIKAMIYRYEDQYGRDKLVPIPARTRQSDEMDRILESFRKLREGLFATQTCDDFAVQGKFYEQSILCSLYAGNIPELTKALHYLIQEVYPAAHTVHPSHGPSPAKVIVPIQSQRFLGLYILYHIAKPTRSVAPSADAMDSFSQVILYPRTETDQCIASLLHEYELHQQIQQQQQQQQEQQNQPKSSHHASDNGDLQGPSVLGPELMFALAYWKTLRTNNWIQRERLLHPRAGHTPVSWDQRLMIRHSMGDALGTARGQTVAAMSKAYYSLPISAMAEAVGLVEQCHGAQIAKAEEGKVAQWVTKLQSSYGLLPTIIIRDDQLMFKAKS